MTKEGQLRNLLKHAWANSRVYREVYTEAGIKEADLEDIPLEDLPVMTKTNLMARFDEAVTDQRLKLEEINQFLKDDRNPRNLYLGEYFALGSSAGSAVASYVPYTLAEWRYFSTLAASSLLPDSLQRESPIRSAFYFASEGHWVSSTNVSLASRQYHDVLSLGVHQPVEEIWARLNAFQPERLSGYGSSITWILDWVLDGKLKIKPDTVVISGDGLAPFYREKVRELWGAKIYDLYATVEAIYIALRGPGEDHFKVYDDLVVMEVVDKDFRSVQPGERGRVLVTNLVQKTLPLIRFDLYDYATLGRSGFGAETLKSLDGKSFDALPIRIEKGKVVRIPAFELKKLKVPGVKHFQFLSHSPDHFEIWYLSDRVLDWEVKSTFQATLGDCNGMTSRMDVRRVDYLPSGRGTKFYNVMNPDKRFVELVSVFDDPIHEQKPIRQNGEQQFPHDERMVEGTIQGAFQQVVERLGDKVAVEDFDSSITYFQLDALSTNVAYRLLNQSFDKTRPVAIYCPHQAVAMALILGVLKAGGFYLPLDTNHPDYRNAQILEDTEPQFIFSTDDELKGRLDQPAPDFDVVSVESLFQMDQPVHTLPEVSNNTPACLVYTSGSIGTPQGFVLSHKTILNRAFRYIEDYQIRPGDRLSFLQSYAVSAGIREIFGALLSGATLCFYDLSELGIQPLPAWVRDSRITHLYMVPSVWRIFLEAIQDQYSKYEPLTAEVTNEVDPDPDVSTGDLPDEEVTVEKGSDGKTSAEKASAEESVKLEGFEALRSIRLGGEAMTFEDWQGYKERMPTHCRLANAYAATETGTICQYFMTAEMDIPSGRVPVGYPVKGAVVKVVKDHHFDKLIALGEIAVESASLALGSWDPISKQVFPFQDVVHSTGDLGYQVQDGRIYLIERKDRIVKVHGYRVNLQEVERMTVEMEAVASAAARWMVDHHGTEHIALFYALEPDCDSSPEAIKAALRLKLPQQAIPKFVQCLKDLPQLPGGKVNPYLLRLDTIDSPPLQIPDITYPNETEEILAGIWREVLRVERIEREADFLDLGGDSIMVFRVQNRIWEHFSVRISVREFFDITQFCAMAGWIVQRKDSTESI